MADYLIEAISITDDDYVLVKFETSLRRASIVDQKFKLFKKNGDETLTQVSDPFYPIDIETDWIPLSKLLKLHFNPETLDEEEDYVLEISGLQNAIGTTLPTVNYTFTTDPSFTDDYTKPDDPAVVIEDHSIKGNVSTGSETMPVGSGANRFHIESVSPEPGSAYLAEGESNGVVTIRLSERVDEQYLTDSYFKVQKKEIMRGPSRWETLPVQISQNESNPIVYVKLPSTDEPPVYSENGKTYFEEGNKYRIIISKHFGVDA